MQEIKIRLIKKFDPISPPLMCPDTMRNVKDVISDIKQMMSKDGIEISFEEKDTNSDDERSPVIIINEKTLEELVPLPNPAKYCGFSCKGCNSDSDSRCLRIYKEIPESVLRLAVKKAAAEL